MQDHHHLGGGLGLAVFDKPRMPGPAGPARVDDFIRLCRFDANVLTHYAPHIHLLHNHLTIAGGDFTERLGKDRKDRRVVLQVGAFRLPHRLPRGEVSDFFHLNPPPSGD